jgi:hypothetical protein
VPCKIINAEGEFQATEKLVQAAAMISAQLIDPATALLTDDEENFERA